MKRRSTIVVIGEAATGAEVVIAPQLGDIAGAGADVVVIAGNVTTGA
jgi:hypothetical protein